MPLSRGQVYTIKDTVVISSMVFLMLINNSKNREKRTNKISVPFTRCSVIPMLGIRSADIPFQRQMPFMSVEDKN